MPLSFTLVDGVEFAGEASRILEEAWQPPVVRYTPAYLQWQLGFPSAVVTPAAAAFDGAEPIGFVAASGRRLRCGATDLDAAIVSFVAVRPGWRGRGVSAGLYQVLLQALADRDIPVITYAIPGSVGERTLLRAYPQGCFQIRPMGAYGSYAFAGGNGSLAADWQAHCSENAALPASLAEACSARNDGVLWSRPDASQTAHYFQDARPRKLIVAEQLSTGMRAAGFVIHSELRTPQGIARVITLDSVWVPGADAGGLAAILRAASGAWLSDTGTRPVVMCPNLSGFDATTLKAAGLRRTSAQFNGYFCWSGRSSWPAFEWTNLEIV